MRIKHGGNPLMRYKDTIKAAKKAIKLAEKNPMLYSNEEILYMKKALFTAKRDLAAKRERLSKGFKNEATTWVGQSSFSDSRSGEDDGVRGESQQPEQPGQS
jgi:hypothetical protein